MFFAFNRMISRSNSICQRKGMEPKEKDSSGGPIKKKLWRPNPSNYIKKTMILMDTVCLVRPGKERTFEYKEHSAKKGSSVQSLRFDYINPIHFR